MSDSAHNLLDALSTINTHWQPRRLTSINDYELKVVKMQGEFVWHTHPATDELFMVVRGELIIQLRDRDVVLRPNDVFVVPKGVEHCPKAVEEVHAILFEPNGTVNTGDAGGDRTAEFLDIEPS
ncbi:cupin domain-containing protein [Vibrio cholerae]|nr:cupin domain-containing protein [Vibrio cholerae]